MTREEAIAVLRREIEPSVYEDEKSIAEALNMAIEALTERPTSEWINSTTKGYVVCSNCNKLTTNINRKKYNYCPFCGAIMENKE